MQTQAEIRQSITNKIVESLKAGRIPWRKPWSGVEGPRTPTNFVTKRRYSGVNIPILWQASQERGYDVDHFATFNQWKTIRANVKKGEKAIYVVLYKPIKKVVTDENGIERVESFPILRIIPVFSIHQVQGDAVEPFLNKPRTTQFVDVNRDEFDRVVAATNADIHFGGATAAYCRLPADYIQMPQEGQFESFPAYAETLAHELAHWSEHRLDWTGNYAEGELRAELSAVFSMAAMNIPDSHDLTNHTAYLGSWLDALENDPKFLFRAAAAASKATDFILAFSRPVESQDVESDEAVAVG